MFRDTFAVDLLLAGILIDQVSVLLGHRRVKMTGKHYLPWVISAPKTTHYRRTARLDRRSETVCCSTMTRRFPRDCCLLSVFNLIVGALGLARRGISASMTVEDFVLRKPPTSINRNSFQQAGCNRFNINQVETTNFSRFQ